MKEFQPKAGSEIDTEDSPKFSRRAIIGAGAGLVLTGGGIFSGAKEYLFKPEGDYHAVDAYLDKRGFSQAPMSEKRFDELSPNHYDRRLTHHENNLDITITNDSDVLAQVSFNLREPQLLSLYISDKASLYGSLPVVEAQYNGIEQEIGILETAHNDHARVMLGELSGQQDIKILRTSASQDIQLQEDAIHIEAIQADPLYEAILRLSPTLGMRRDNYVKYISAQTDEERTDALTNDMLLAMPVEIRENDRGQLAIIYWGLYTSEDGGWGKDAKKMYQKTGGRLFDSDIASIVTLDSDYNVIEAAHQEDNEHGKHQMKIDFPFSPSVKPFDQFLHSVPDHGLVGYGLEPSIPKVWRPRPIIRAISPSAAMEDLYSGARVAALKEQIREAKAELPVIRLGEDPFAINQINGRLIFLQSKLDDEYKKVAA